LPKLDSKIAFVTGGGGGIGGAVARLFAMEGAMVIVADAKIDAAVRVANEIMKNGGKARAEHLDVTKWTEIESLVNSISTDFGGIDILVNCAGIVTVLPFQDISEEKWDMTMDINAKGTFLCCKAVGRSMIQRGSSGKIVNIASMLGKIGAQMYTHYSASKFAVIGITKCLALELAKYHINVNSVCPGDTDTDMLHAEARLFGEKRNLTEEQILKEWASSAPLEKLIQPSDVAGLVLFLASSDSDLMTGQAINITAGKLTA
jgi:NAD(P)-dependent dehydrogenase (short-subunit alcohol dehydrogenase family)